MAGKPRATYAKKPAAKKSAAKKPAAKKSAAKKPAVSKPAVSKPAVSKPAAGKPAVSKPATTPAPAPPSRPAPRADLGAPIDGFFRKQSPLLRPILETLRGMVEAAAPEATSSIKWGMPFFVIGDAMMCALGAHKAHVNLILWGPPGTFDDPDGRLAGDGKTGRHLKLTRLDDLPADSVRGWLETAAELARARA